MRAGGIFPHYLSRLLDNPMRRLLLSPEHLVERMGLTEASRVLEIGPGSGFFSVALAKRLSGGELVLLDIQSEMLAKAKRKLERLGFQKVRYITSDASEELPCPDSYFDFVLLVCVLGEIRDQSGCLRTVRRVIRTGGILTVHESLPDPDMIGLDDLVSLIEPQGFAFRRRWGWRWNYTATFEAVEGMPRSMPEPR